MNDKTKFLSTPGRVTSTMRAIMALCTRDLELATNVTARSPDSRPVGLSMVSYKSAGKRNLNPVNVTIESFSFSHPSVSLHMDGIYNPQGVQIRGSRPIPKQAHMKKVLTLQAGHRLALTLEVLAQEPTAGGPPVTNASVQLVTKRGEKITIRTRYESVLGGLSFSPASLRFEASFPGQAGSALDVHLQICRLNPSVLQFVRGQIQSRVVAARSTFEQPLQLDAGHARVLRMSNPSDGRTGHCAKHA
ncbi:unnamed protein product [Effrenium voratum]|nr:unnamed protein product [Effrenium voratum]